MSLMRFEELNLSILKYFNIYKVCNFTDFKMIKLIISGEATRVMRVREKLTVGGLLHVIRKNMQINDETAVFCFIENRLYSLSTSIGSIADSWGLDCMSCHITHENAFGGYRPPRSLGITIPPRKKKIF